MACCLLLVCSIIPVGQNKRDDFVNGIENKIKKCGKRVDVARFHRFKSIDGSENKEIKRK